MQQREVYDRRMCQDKVVDGVKLAFTRGLKYRLQIVDISDIEFLVSHHGDYIRKDRPILLKSTDSYSCKMDQVGIFKEHTRKHGVPLNCTPKYARQTFVTTITAIQLTEKEAR